jgi:ribose transport system permease protein
MIKRLIKIRELVILLAVIVTVLIFYLIQPGYTNRFFTLSNLEAILLGASLDGLIAIGMTFVIITGGFDLSVGSTFAFGGLIAGEFLLMGYPVPIAIIASTLCGALVGFINGVFISKVKVNAFVTTLGTMTILRGIVLLSTQGNPLVGFPASFVEIGQGKLFGVFYPIIILVVALIAADFLLRRSKFLRQTYYIGGNEEAAKLSGINVDKVKTWTYVITGMLASVAGIISTAKTGSTSPISGTGAELRIIAAVIIGGASLSGGSGTIFGTFLGLMLTGIITNGLGFLRISYYAEGIVSGSILIIAVMLDQLTKERFKMFIKFLTTTRSKRMERILNIILIICILGLLIFRPWVSKNSTEVTTSKVNSLDEYVFLGVSVGSPYWLDARLGLEDKGVALGVKTDFRGPAGNDPNQQVKELESVIARKPAGILIAPASEALTPSINRAVENGIPVICIDTDAPNSKRYCYIGTDNYNAGFQTGNMLAKSISGKGKVAILTIPGQQNLEIRVKGCIDALAKYPAIEVVKIGNDLGLSSEAEKVSRSILQAYPDLAGFGCVDAGGGEGAAVVVKELGKVGIVKIIAMDRNEPTLDFIEQGVIESSIAQRTYTMAYIGLQLLHDLHNNLIKLVNNWEQVGIVPLPQNIDTGTILIDKSNVSSFRKKNKL